MMREGKRPRRVNSRDNVGDGRVLSHVASGPWPTRCTASGWPWLVGEIATTKIASTYLRDRLAQEEIDEAGGVITEAGAGGRRSRMHVTLSLPSSLPSPRTRFFRYTSIIGDGLRACSPAGRGD